MGHPKARGDGPKTGSDAVRTDLAGAQDSMNCSGNSKIGTGGGEVGVCAYQTHAYCGALYVHSITLPRHEVVSLVCI